jgi:hypothetical protein
MDCRGCGEVHLDQNNVCASFRETNGHGSTEASGASGHDGRLPGKAEKFGNRHVCPLFKEFSEEFENIGNFDENIIDFRSYTMLPQL